MKRMKRIMVHMLSVLLVLSCIGAGLEVFDTAPADTVYAAGDIEVNINTSYLRQGDVIEMGKAEARRPGYISSTTLYCGEDNPQWIVLDVDKNNKKALLISRTLWNYKSAGDWEMYGISSDAWQGSRLQKWCNDLWSSEIFSKYEKTLIRSDAAADISGSYGTCDLTNEHVFVLSANEYSLYKNIIPNVSNIWFTRTSSSKNEAYYVDKDGTISVIARLCAYPVRPAFYLDLSQDIPAYREAGEANSCWHIKQKPEISAAETRSLTYNGQPQSLLADNTVTTSVGTLYYAVTTSKDTAPGDSDWSEDVPAATEPGTYYAWYKVGETTRIFGTEPAYVTVTINKQNNNLSYPTRQSVSVQESSSAQTVSITKASANTDVSYTIKTQKTSVDFSDLNYNTDDILAALKELQKRMSEVHTVSYFSVEEDGSLTVAANTPIDKYSIEIAAVAAETAYYNSNQSTTTVSVSVLSADDYEKMSASDSVLNVKAKKTVTVKKSSLKEKAKKIRLNKLMKVISHAGLLTFKKVSVKKDGKSCRKYFAIDSEIGTLKVKKNTPKGTYKIRIRVTDDGIEDADEASKTVTVKVKVE